MGLLLNLATVAALDDAAAIRAAIEAEHEDPSGQILVIEGIFDCLDAIICPDGEGPLARALFDGDPVSGPGERVVAALPVEEVGRIAAALDQMDFSAALLASREVVEEMYGGSIVGEEDEDDFRDLFHELRNFYAQAASRREPVIKW